MPVILKLRALSQLREHGWTPPVPQRGSAPDHGEAVHGSLASGAPCQDLRTAEHGPADLSLERGVGGLQAAHHPAPASF